MLDDFFTLTEINNGLAVPSRVKELVAVMQKDRNCVFKNAGEAIRQWSAVATAIAATENHDCLHLFIHLDGLQFFSKWLKDAQKFSDESNDSLLEESTIHLLQALRKLHVDYEKLVAAEIWTTVEDLLLHKSLKVKHEAQLLFESWKKKRNGDDSLSNDAKFGALADVDVGKSANIGRPSESWPQDDSLSGKTSCKEVGLETREDPMLSASFDAVHPDQVQRTYDLDKVSDASVRDDAPSGHAILPSLLKPTTELPICHSSVESCNPTISREESLDVQIEFHELESASNLMDTPKVESPQAKSGSIEGFNPAEERTFPVCSNSADAMKSVAQSSSQNLIVARSKISSDEGSSSDSDGKCSMGDLDSADEYKNSSAFTTEQGDEYEKSWEPTGFSDHRKIKIHGLHVNSDCLGNNFKFPDKGTQREPEGAHKKSDVELYGIIDPLEVARQVAIEVEREIVGYTEQSYSSSEKLPKSIEMQPGSPNSGSGNRTHASEVPPNDMPNGPDLLAEASPIQEESATSTGNLDEDQPSGKHDMKTSQVSEAALEENNKEREVCNFDLNQVVCSEDADLSSNQFIGSVSIVSASRAAAPPGLPVAPLQFEGNLGWKGSAATSAFRAASPWKLPGSEPDLSTGGSSSNSKQQQRCLDIDLNMAEIHDGRTGDLPPSKNTPGLPSIESSMETNARRSEHLNLDLNLATEDGACPSDWRMGQFFPQANSQQDRCHSSSSSSKQPSFKSLDLNDQPSFLSDSYYNPYLNKSSQNFNIYGGMKSDDSVISIMGTRVEVKRKDLVPPCLALPNAQNSEFALDVNLSRTGNFLGMGSVLPYAHSSIYGYNKTAPGPPIPFSSNIYESGGPLPYMMDSGGAPVIPQMIGFSQTPFFINMADGVEAVVPSQSSFDLNSGTMVEGGSRDTAGFLNLSRVRSMDEQLRSNAQPTIGSVVSGKRKEPDNGWEQYHLKHYTPPYK